MDRNKIKWIILTLIFVCAIITGCCLLKKTSNTKETNITMIARELFLNGRQLDSLCNADNIPNDFDYWSEFPFNDYETSTSINKKLFIKDSTDILQIVYILTQENDSIYNVVIREQRND